MQTINQNNYEYDAKGNLTKMEIAVDYYDLQTGTLYKNEHSFSYTYDKKKGAFSNVNVPTWVITNYMEYESVYLTNNCLSIYHIEENYINGILNEKDPENYFLSYNYNTDGYPTNVAGGSIVFRYVEAK